MRENLRQVVCGGIRGGFPSISAIQLNDQIAPATLGE